MCLHIKEAVERGHHNMAAPSLLFPPFLHPPAERENNRRRNEGGSFFLSSMAVRKFVDIAQIKDCDRTVCSHKGERTIW